MMVINVIENLLLMLGGITVFLYGLSVMSENVRAVAGGKLGVLLARATGSPLRGVISGAVATAVVQSSTAINIMLVGFVNAGIIGLAQAIPVVMGANVGTTVTAQLVSLSGSNIFNITAMGSLVAFIGFLLTLGKAERARRAGGIMLGFGLVFIGLEIMNASVCAFRTYSLFRRLFTVSHPLLMLVNGFLITAITQSSSAVSSFMIILALNGIITFEGGMYLLLGANIGAGVAVLIVSAGLGEEARRVALANLLFNILGTAILIVPLMLFEGQVACFFARVSGGIERQIANFHTAFNLFTTLTLLPFVKFFERLVVVLSSLKIGKRISKVKSVAVKNAIRN